MLTVGLLLVGAASLLAAASERDVPPGQSSPVLEEPPPNARRTRVQVLWLLMAGGAAAGAYLGAADNSFRLWGVAAWVAAVAAWLVAVWPAASAPRHGDGPVAVLRQRVRTHPIPSLLALAVAGGAVWLPPLAFALLWFVPVSRERLDGLPRAVGRRPAGALAVVALVLIVGTGALLRFSTLRDTPSDPTSDHAEKLLDIGDLLAGEERIYFPRNTGREPLQFYVTGYGLIEGLGMPYRWETLKAGTAAVDTLAIIVLFLIARELGGTRAGLIAAALYAVAAWPTINAVFGLRPSYGPLTAGLALWGLLRYLRTGDRRDALLTGVALGGGLYGYTAFRTVPIAVVVILAAAVAFDPRLRRRRRRTAIDGGVMAVTAAVVAMPLIRYALQYPDMFWYRTRTRASDAARDIGGNDLGARLDRLSIFLENNWHAAQMFHWRGDATWVNFAPGRPALDVVTGAALLAGLLLTLHRVATRRDARAAALLLALPIFALSSTLAIAFPHESPSFSRSSLLGPIVFVMAALGVEHVRRRVAAAVPRSGEAVGWLLVLPLLVVAAQENGHLLDAYGENYRLSIVNTAEVVRAIEDGEVVGVDLDHAYLLGAPFWLDHRNVAFGLGRISWGDTHNLTPEMPFPDQADGAPLLFIVKLDDTERLGQLRARWPTGVATQVHSARPGRDFLTFFVPGTG